MINHPSILGQEREKILDSFQQVIKIKFKDETLLNQALTHSSYFLSKEKKLRRDNQRLEFLGDSCLALVVTEYLYKKYDSFPEGQLSKAKNFVVSQRVLHQIAISIQLGNFLLMSQGELKNKGNEKSGALSDAFEALIGAIYLDRGYDIVREFLLFFLKKEIEIFFKKNTSAIDYKSELQYLVQKKHKTYPIYRLLGEAGPNHDKEFTMEISILGKNQFAATGKTKKEAEQKAAEYIYNLIKNEQIIL